MDLTVVGNIFYLVGGLGLFLYGIHIMSEGLQKATGSKLSYYLGKATDNRLMGVIVGAAGTRFLCVPRPGPRLRLWCYAGSGRLTSTTIERYTVNITAADRYLVLMTSEIWERLSMPSIERMCLDAQTPEDASAALVAAARAYQGRANAAAVVIRLS